MIFALIFCFISLNAQVEERIQKPSQEKEKGSFGQRIFVGGDIGLSFGTITYIKLAPEINYRFTDRFSAGLGPIYIYEKYKDFNFETSTYGGKIVASFTVLKGPEEGGAIGLGAVILHAENEVVNVERVYYDPGTIPYTFYTRDRIWIDNLLLGAGLIQPIAGRFKAAIYVLWDITQNDFSPYSNPIFKFGFYY
ncbi:MAG: hypothetical protein R6X09_11940 [Bacteroidales bacterium]